jgi:NAD(P)-dependent dehydrogenase (short-subunit alcohol dehydrogenase family)
MEEVGEMLRNKEIRAVSSLKTFDISELESALLYFSQGKHIGKVVVTYEDEESMVQVRSPILRRDRSVQNADKMQMTPPKPSAKFDASALYILVGGLGGFGRGILQWMIAKGARNLAVWSRSGKAAPEAEALLSEYRHAGVNISIERCDITDMASVQSAVAIADGQAYPLKGVVHAAITFCDQAFEMLSYDQWRLGLSAKVTGTENLHNATLGHDLDFFVMTSSYEAVVALPTQAAYCAANSFQDAFARHRRAMGLPATAVALGLITEIGDAGQRDITRLMIDRNNLYGTGELGSLRLLEAAFMDVPVLDKASDTFERDWAHSDYLAGAQITTCLEPVKLAEMLKKNGTTRGVPRWTVDLKFSHIMQAVNDLMTSDEAAPSGPSQNETSSGVDAALKTGSIDMARDLLVVATKERIAGLLRIPIEGIEAEKSVAAYGVDSLIAVELRSWFVTSFQSTVPLLRLLDESVSMNDLAGGIIKERQEKVLAL